MEVQKCVIFLKACFLSAKALAQEPEDGGGGENGCVGDGARARRNNEIE